MCLKLQGCVPFLCQKYKGTRFRPKITGCVPFLAKYDKGVPFDGQNDKGVYLFLAKIIRVYPLLAKTTQSKGYPFFLPLPYFFMCTHTGIFFFLSFIFSTIPGRKTVRTYLYGSNVTSPRTSQAGMDTSARYKIIIFDAQNPENSKASITSTRTHLKRTKIKSERMVSSRVSGDTIFLATTRCNKKKKVFCHDFCVRSTKPLQIANLAACKGCTIKLTLHRN